MAVLRDLSEALACGLTALAVLAFDPSRRLRIAASSALFALAVLTRETTAVFAVVWAGALFSGGRGPRASWRRALLFLTGALVPYLAYKGFLNAWLGGAGIPHTLAPDLPFAGIAKLWPWGAGQIQQVYAVVLPGTFCLAVACYALWRRAFEPAVFALAANAFLYAVLLAAPAFDDFYASLRVSAGVLLALLLAAPALQRVLGTGRTWLWIPALAWYSAWWQLLPIAVERTW